MMIYTHTHTASYTHTSDLMLHEDKNFCLFHSLLHPEYLLRMLDTLLMMSVLWVERTEVDNS